MWPGYGPGSQKIRPSQIGRPEAEDASGPWLFRHWWGLIGVAVESLPVMPTGGRGMLRPEVSAQGSDFSAPPAADSPLEIQPLGPFIRSSPLQFSGARTSGPYLLQPLALPAESCQGFMRQRRTDDECRFSCSEGRASNGDKFRRFFDTGSLETPTDAAPIPSGDGKATSIHRQMMSRICLMGSRYVK